MKWVKICLQVCFIYFLNVLGGAIQAKLNLPIPGSIIGLIILFLLLTCKIIPEKWIQGGANFLLSIMILFLIPATVGVMNYFSIFSGKGIALIIGLILSTCLVIVTSGFICEIMGQKNSPRTKEKLSA